MKKKLNCHKNESYIVMCQAHPALVKQVQWSVRLFQFPVVYSWPMSRCCLGEPRWFVVAGTRQYTSIQMIFLY